MLTTISSTFNLLTIILLAICLTVLFMVALYKAQTLMVSNGWHGLASIGWNG
jgi:hypothetical protein